jgi:hypothetical protein
LRLGLRGPLIAVELDKDIYIILYPYVFVLYSLFSLYALITGTANINQNITKESPRAKKVEENSIEKGQKKQA